MKRNYLKASLVIAFAISYVPLFAQNIGINSTGVAANSSAILDLNTGNNYTSPNGKGFIVPNVALTGVNDAVTIASPATSLMVYVPNGSGLAPAGYYYNSGTPGAPVWSSLGGGGLAGGTTNYLARWTSATTLGIGVTEDNNVTVSMSNPASVPIANQMLTVTGNATAINAIVGSSAASGGAGVTGTLANPGASGGYGVRGTVSGNGGGFQYAIYGASTVTAGNGIGVWGQATGGGAAINYGGYFNATGGATNYGVIVPPGGGFVGLGTITPARQLEVGNTLSTIRNDGIKLGSTYYSTVTPTNANSSVMFVNNSTGDEQALAPGTNGQVLAQTAAGPAWQNGVSAGVLIAVASFTAGQSGNFTPVAGTSSMLVKMVGGGGAGGGANWNGCPQFWFAGAGGGSGAYVEYFVANPVGPYAFSVGTGGVGNSTCNTAGGAGGATTFNGVSAGGGGGGAVGNSNNGNGKVAIAGGAAGTPAGGTVNIAGNVGGNAWIQSNNFSIQSGNGAGSVFGSGAQGSFWFNWSFAGNIAGASGNSPGTGGAGSLAVTGTVTGGNGAGGIIIIYEYK